MRADIISFIMVSENRKKIAKALFEYPKRQWSCSALEDITKISHATVFRTIVGLIDFGILRSTKVNRKDMLYELVDAPLSKELNKIINIERTTAKKIAISFIDKIKSKQIYSAVLYGSAVKGDLKPGSDIDILIVLSKHDKSLEKKIFDMAGSMSYKLNKTIAVTLLDEKEVINEKNSQFMKSVRTYMEVLYGKEPF